jgi:hypothetical protein
VLNDNDFKKIIRRGLEEWVKWYSACLASVKPSVQTLVLFPPAKKKKPTKIQTKTKQTNPGANKTRKGTPGASPLV